MKKIIPALIIVALAAACGCVSKNAKNTGAGTGVKTVPGADADKHGCRASAGYTWSEVRQDCIRVFEEGIKMISADPDATQAAYAVFSGDGSKVELFIPGEKPAVLSPAAEKDTWTDAENPRGPSLAKIDGGLLEITVRGKAVYRQASE